ncbi:MAG: hypothetical protein JXQ29_08780 [Planctomycetes bacterium]|nr:hypothetical protein [Planctomycetota bacterium]
MADPAGRLRLLVLCVALAPAGFGCGISTYQVRFVPDGAELKSQPSIQVYVYFAAAQDVERCLKLEAKELFDRGGDFERDLVAQRLHSTVVSAAGAEPIHADRLPGPVVKVFLWGRFAGKTREGADRLVVEPDRFLSSWLSTHGVLEVPVHPTGFGTPR